MIESRWDSLSAAWLNSAGFTATVLKYRSPNNRAGALLEMPRRASGLARHSLLDARAKFEKRFLSP